MAGKLNFATPFNRPILARHNNELVQIVAIGDVEGMSPSYLYVDSSGRSAWGSLDQFEIQDHNVLPNTTVERLVTAGRR